MADLVERVTTLETQSDRHLAAIEALRNDIAGLRAESGMLRGEMATRTDIIEVRREIADLRNDMNRRFELVDAKFDRQFYWLTGIMISGFIAVISALIGVAYK